ncbi:MAG: hypothetical protein NT150_09025 [Bacteroidetes bacterium]|nr:hypothetical protein [Bacteroidota bacterium]
MSITTLLFFPFLKKNKNTVRWISGGISALSLVFLILFFPSRKENETSPESLFLDKNENRVEEPLPSYLCNFITEADVVRLSTFYSALLPLPAGGVIAKEWDEMNAFDNVFLREYDESLMQPCVSQVTPFQAFQDLGCYKDMRHFYCYIPKHLPNAKAMRVVVFLHGYMGNFQFYLNYFRRLENTVVLAPSTSDLNGKWTNSDLMDIVKLYLPMVNNQVKLDFSDIHLIGLSNGGSGVNVAINNFSKHFISFTFISAYPEAYTSKKITLICGMKDSFANKNKEYAQEHPSVQHLFFSEERHFSFLNKKAEILNFIDQ